MKEKITNTNPSVKDYKIAISSIWCKLNKKQKKILIYSYTNPGASFREISKYIGYNNVLPINGLYGRMAHRLYNSLGKEYELDNGSWLNILGEFELISDNHSKFKMSYKMVLRPQVIRALKELNLFEV